MAKSSRGSVMTVDEIILDNGRTGPGRDNLAVAIAERWDEWKMARNKWEQLASEVRAYVFATDTKTTTNARLPWSNSTTTPKLCQVRDNLHANYMAAMFPNDNWFDWEPYDMDSADKNKASNVHAYMRVKTEQSGFKTDIEKLILDYIDYGNAFATVEFVANHFEGAEDEEPIQGYVGPRVVRISPLDIVYNITANSFDEAPKIVRSVISLGDLKKRISRVPDEEGKWQDTYDLITKFYQDVSAHRATDTRKNKALSEDGLGPVWTYMDKGDVEILEFYGDLYDHRTGDLYEDHLITVVNRSFVIQMEPYKSYTGKCPIKHVGWRSRPDNLWAMGPLDNLVGLQYRIDHLENMKADIFDKIAHPKPYLRGETSEWTEVPGEPIYGDENSDVRYITPDSTALNADFQINMLEQRMEEMAGAPKQAMGIRTPGEKTAYEVQSLENAAGRVFQNKIQHFESEFLEPLLNEMFAAALKSQWLQDRIAVRDRINNFSQFLTLEKDDITARGIIRPRGARHFAAKAMLVQNINNLWASALGQDEGVRVHFSGKQLASLMQDALNLEPYRIYKENAQVFEHAETMKLMQAAEEQVMSEGMVDPNEGVDEEAAAMSEVMLDEGL